MESGVWVLIANVAVAIIGGLAAYSAQRASAKANKENVVTTSRVDMEKEAYDRARKFDVETIERQDKEIDELRKEVVALKAENQDLKIESRRLKIRVEHLERMFPNE